MGLVKLQVVHALEAALDFCGRRGVGDIRGQEHQQEKHSGEPFRRNSFLDCPVEAKL